MSLITYWNERIKYMDWLDIGLIKFSIMGFTLMLVKFWGELLSLEWHWYLIFTLVLAIRPLYRVYIK